MIGLAWRKQPGCIGPSSPAVWNRLSMLQVETLEEALLEGMTVADMAAVTDASIEDVEGFLRLRGLPA